MNDASLINKFSKRPLSLRAQIAIEQARCSHKARDLIGRCYHCRHLDEKGGCQDAPR